MTDYDAQSSLSFVSEITEFNDLHDFMNDDQLDRAMELVVKCIMQPDVAAQKAPRLIVELQALSTKFALAAATYATFKKDKAGTTHNNKKNVYYSTKEAIDKLVDALKYAARYGV